MKLLLFYIILGAPLAALVLFSKAIPSVWFVLGFAAYLFYNLIVVNQKLKRKGYRVGLFAHLNPFNKGSQELYHKAYFEA